MDQTADLWIDWDGDVESFPAPPVETRVQTLPFERLTWENFERLCYRLAWRSGDVSDCRRYGIQGQDQQGIDIYIRRTSDGGYSTWQCKRYREFTPVKIEEAVDRFLENDWATRSTAFSLAVTVSLSPTALADTVVKQTERCKEHGVEFVPLDADRLSVLLKDHPDLVDDFFGRPWAEAFCGSDAAQRLSGRRLTRQQRIQARHRLRDLYTTHFASIDIGLPAAGSTLRDAAPPLPLRDRYVVPCVESIHTVLEQRRVSSGSAGAGMSQQELSVSAQKPLDKEAKTSLGFRSTEHRAKSDLLDWFAAVHRGVILGGPGSGKSAALHFMALDLLSDQPKAESAARKWGGYLPLFVPFAMLTRLMAKEKVVGMGDFLRGWLTKLSASSGTFSLLEQALDDERLLLLIDGLDEWSDSTAARAALIAIIDFAEPRRLPVIASARPLGYDRLGGLGPDWRKAELLPFENEQQRRFTKAWFLHFHDATSAGEKSRDAVASAATRDTESFMAEVELDRALSELAGIPLLLSALIFLRLQGGVLPRNRFDAIDALTRALIHEQPMRRAAAALRGSDVGQPNPRITELGIQSLALFIHEQPGSESVPEDQAREALAAFYRGPEFKKSDAEAIELATAQVERATQEVGILVQSQPEHVGFLHRSLQEFLAAKELVRRPFVDIKRYVVGNCSDAGWQEVLLGVLHLMVRKDEVDTILTEVRKTPSTPLESSLRQIFLARAIFTDLNCSASVAEEVAEEIFSAIELSTWMPLRKALLSEAVQGLDSEVLGRHIRNRLRRWFPERQQHRFGLCRALAERPVPGTGRRLLVALLNADNGYDVKEIAEAIALGAGTWPEVGETLATILTQPADDDVLAAVLHALATGWPQDSRLSSLLLAASESRADSLRCIGLVHRVKGGDTSDKVKQTLTEFCRREGRAYSWIDAVLKALEEGWPGDPELRKAAMESTRRGWTPTMWNNKLALRYLVEAFPGDNDVAQVIAELLTHEDHLRIVLDPTSTTWNAVLERFKSHPLIAPAAEAWMHRHGTEGYDVVSIGQVAMLGRTEVCKQILIDRLKAEDRFPQWIFHALLDLGGSDDREAKEAMLSFIGDEKKTASVANYLPDLIGNSDDCYKRLLDLLKSTSGFDVAHVLDGLDKLDRLESPEVIAVLERRLQEDEGGQFWHQAKPLLWKKLPQLPLARQGALKELEREYSFLSMVASAYVGDGDVRFRLEELLEPLHRDLRLTLTRSLRSFALRDDPFARDLLALYTREWDGEVRTVAADAYYSAVKRRGGKCRDYVAQLWNELSVPGLQDEIQHAAIAGLLALGEMDTVMRQQGSDVPMVSTHGGTERNWEFIRIIEENWEHLCAMHGDAAWKLFRDWHVFVWHPAQTGSQRPAIAVPLPLVNEARIHAHQDVDAFWVLASVEAGQETFREFCLNLFRKMRRSTTGQGVGWAYKEEEVWLEAARYLAIHYAGDVELGAELEGIAQDSHARIGPMIALCRGWPQAELIEKIWQTRSSKPPRSDAETAWIVNVKAGVAQLIDYVHSLPVGLQSNRSWDFPYETIRAVRNRLLRDTEAQQVLLESIEDSDSPDVLASLPRLVSTVARDRQPIRGWAARRIIELRKKGTIQPMGYDMLSGRVRPVEFCLLDACEGT